MSPLLPLLLCAPAAAAAVAVETMESLFSPVLGLNDDRCGGHNAPNTSGDLQIAAVGDSITAGAHSTGGSCCNWPHAGQTNWTQDCSDMKSPCPFVEDYAKFVALVKTLGTSAAGPKIWLAHERGLARVAGQAVREARYIYRERERARVCVYVCVYVVCESCVG